MAELLPERVRKFQDELRRYQQSDHRITCDIFNKPLYVSFVENRQGLRSANAMKALFTLLDKAYSAGLRRSFRETENPQGLAPVDVIVRSLCAEKGYAGILDAIDGLGAMLRPTDVPGIALQVTSLCDLLTKAGGGEKRPLSFASKYLHFYSGGVVPIWDSYARSGIATLQGRKRFSGDYGHYAQAFADLCEQIHGRAQIKPEEAKLVDNCLIASSYGWAN